MRMSPLGSVINRPPAYCWEPVLLGEKFLLLGRSTSACYRRLGEQPADRLGELRALGDPVINTVTLHVKSRRAGARVIQSHHFHRTAVAGAFLVDDNYTIIRLFARADARHANH